MRVVVAEFERVLADTAATRAEAWRAACRAAGVGLPSDDLLALAVRDTTEEAAARLATALAPDDGGLSALLALAAERDATSRFARGVQLRAGAAAFVTACASEGRVGIVSRASRVIVATALALAGLEEVVAFVWSADDRARDGAAAVSRALGTAPRGARLAVLGDRADWLAAAAGAGARRIAVPDAPPEVTPDATWDSFQGRVPRDLDG